MLFKALLAVLAGYILGSFPSAYLAGRIVKKEDIRNVGGGNVGTLNTLRQVGFVPGLLVFIADAGKGALAVLVAKWIGAGEITVFAAGLAAVAGHNWPVFLRFRGGRGGATGYGIFLALALPAASIVFGLMLCVLMLTSNARLSLTAGFVVQPFLIWAFGGSFALIAYSVAVPFLLGSRMLFIDLRKVKDPSVRKNLIIDRDYKWWQSKRNSPEKNKTGGQK
jgi:acyl phosphate:glycerol-3-phosphate acyltransferase